MPREDAPPAKRAPKQSDLPRSELARVVLILTLTSTCGSLVFNFTTNGNGELMADRLRAVTADPAVIGALLGVVYVIASFAQLVVGRAIDRYPLKRLFLVIVLAQIPLFALAMHAQGWAFYAARVRVHGVRVRRDPVHRRADRPLRRRPDAFARGGRPAGDRAGRVSSLAVWMLGPLVKANGFAFLLGLLAVIAAVSAVAVTQLPKGK